MKKLLGFLTLAICSLGLIVGVKAAEEYPNVVDATKPDAIPHGATVTVTGAKSELVTVTVSDGEWHLLDDSVFERPDGYSWVGLTFTMPSGAQNIKITSAQNNGSTDYHNDASITDYFGFNLEEIENAVRDLKPNLTKDFTLTWQDAEGNNLEQKIHFVIEFAKITMKDDYSDDRTEDEVWSEEIYETAKEEAEVNHTHKITVVTEHGKVDVPATALMGTEVTLKITPDAGYELDKIVVDDESVKIEDNKFVMPDKDVTLTVTFKKVKVEPEVKPSDTTTTDTTTTDTTTEENPSTFDGIVVYVTLGVAALGTTMYASKKFLKKEN